MKNYISNIRKKIGHDKLIHPAVRVLIENPEGKILFVKKRNSFQLGIPAGSLEENETIEKCAYREVLEETGLEVESLLLIGISSNPERETVSYPNGDIIQYFVVEFYCNKWKGEIRVNDTNEIQEACFLDKSFIKKLPPNEKRVFQSLTFFQTHQLPLIR